jgi:ribose 5-phosphate isomerase A
MDPREDEKRAAAEAAALEVQNGTTLGLGTGSTVAHFLPALARRKMEVMCVATSPATEEMAHALGLTLQPFDLLERLDLAVDGADQVGPDLWLVKGGGGAHTREKIVAEASERFLVIVSTDKLVERLAPPVPVEILTFGLAATLRRLSEIGGVEAREGPPTPDGNRVFDLMGGMDDPPALASELDSIPGVVGHGLFQPELVSEVIVGRGDGTVGRLRHRT